MLLKIPGDEVMESVLLPLDRESRFERFIAPLAEVLDDEPDECPELNSLLMALDALRWHSRI